MLGKAIALAAQVHCNDVDKGGHAYILHPIRIMMRLRTDDEELQAIAILHDVIEDHGDELWKGTMTVRVYIHNTFSTRIKTALSLLTHKEGVSYEDYVKDICSSYDAIRVKIEDLRDNSDITRLKGVRDKDLKRIEKYHKAYLKLTEAKNKFESGA